MRVILDAKVPVFSFIYGIPPKEIFDECRAQGILTIGAATTPDEAIILEQAGVDVIAASGFEAGGHRGSFLSPAEESLTGTFSLVPQVADAVSVPVVAAGGIADARGIVAAFALGAERYKSAQLFWLAKNPVRARITATRSLEGLCPSSILTINNFQESHYARGESTLSTRLLLTDLRVNAQAGKEGDGGTRSSRIAAHAT